MANQNQSSLGTIAVRWTAKVLKQISMGAIKARRELLSWEMRRRNVRPVVVLSVNEEILYEPGDTVSDPIQAA